jgi:hypothetical protein
MRNGMSFPPCCRQPSPAGVLVRLCCGRSSTPSSISTVAAVPGVCCRRTFRPIRRSTTTFEVGARMARGPRSMMLCATFCARRPGVKPVRAQPLSIVRARRPQKRGPQGLRCREESPRPEAAYPRRHLRLDPGLCGSPSGYPGSRWGEAGA